MAIEVVDKRGSRSRLVDDQIAVEAHRAAQEAWARQAAGTLWWTAQQAARNGNVVLADSILTEYAALVRGAREKGITSL